MQGRSLLAPGCGVCGVAPRLAARLRDCAHLGLGLRLAARWSQAPRRSSVCPGRLGRLQGYAAPGLRPSVGPWAVRGVGPARVVRGGPARWWSSPAPSGEEGGGGGGAGVLWWGGFETWGCGRAGLVSVGSGLRTLGKAPPPCGLGRGAVASLCRARCCSFCGPRSVLMVCSGLCGTPSLLCRAKCPGRCAPPFVPFVAVLAVIDDLGSPAWPRLTILLGC